jgi:hypothetical protein
VTIAPEKSAFAPEDDHFAPDFHTFAPQQPLTEGTTSTRRVGATALPICYLLRGPDKVSDETSPNARMSALDWWNLFTAIRRMTEFSI